MIIKFEDFLNEYHGSHSTIGFRYSEPKDEYGFYFKAKGNDEETVSNLEELISKYDIKGNTIKKEDGTLLFKFKAYSENEAKSILTSVLSDLVFDYKVDVWQGTIVFGHNLDYKMKKIGFKSVQEVDRPDVFTDFIENLKSLLSEYKKMKMEKDEFIKLLNTKIDK